MKISKSPNSQIPKFTILLASSSPRRAELLRGAGIAFDVVPAEVDETPFDDEAAEAHVARLAEQKAQVVSASHPAAVVLGADTVVVVDRRILGKPRDVGDARQMLRALSGRDHDVLTGVCVVHRGQITARDISRTRVWFFPLSEAEIDWYLETGEPMDKAGAYAIQGLASRFVERIEGSYANVVGLPVAQIYRVLRDLPEFRHRGGR